MIAVLGAFDGFHTGHQSLLRRAASLSETIGTTWGVITFQRHPDALFSDGNFRRLFTAREQRALERYFETPEVFRMEFTRGIANMTPSAFLDFISDDFGVDGVVVGEDFRFGRDRAGTREILESECRKRVWRCEILPILHDRDGVRICSTGIRSAVSAGEMGRAREMLGYPYFCVSDVIHGSERGAALGFPTANLRIPPEKVELRGGVYATLALVGGEWAIGAANVGLNPTFGDIDETRFEINLAGYEGSLYGMELSVFLLEYIRAEHTFENAAALKVQIARDVEKIRAIGAEALAKHPEMWEKLRSAMI
jgi:riboflavin kinase/FMN adenylyltransferase